MLPDELIAPCPPFMSHVHVPGPPGCVSVPEIFAPEHAPVPPDHEKFRAVEQLVQSVPLDDEEEDELLDDELDELDELLLEDDDELDDELELEEEDDELDEDDELLEELELLDDDGHAPHANVTDPVLTPLKVALNAYVPGVGHPPALDGINPVRQKNGSAPAPRSTRTNT